MNNYKLSIYGGFIISIIGMLLTVLSYLRNSFAFLLLGSFLIVAGILVVVIIMSLNLFVKDKQLEIEKLKEMGLTIVVCKECLKENVLEDQYCIYCGESLGSDENELQEEHKT